MIRVLQILAPDNFHLDQAIRSTLEQFRESFHQKLNPSTSGVASTEGHIAFWWKVFMSLLIFSFFLSCISHFAQYYQLIIDQEDSLTLRDRLLKDVKLDITSPNSGRLKLPPPTPLKVS
jgi:hypothetical protein